jgi:hypothetical protein
MVGKQAGLTASIAMTIKRDGGAAECTRGFYGDNALKIEGISPQDWLSAAIPIASSRQRRNLSRGLG